MFEDDMTFCPYECNKTSCRINNKNIREYDAPHSYYVYIPKGCPRGLGGIKAINSVKKEPEKTIEELNKEHFDKIDFLQFIPNRFGSISVKELMRTTRDYYEDEHPELLDGFFDGYIFNYISEYEFAEYLKKRYSFAIDSVEEWFIYKTRSDS